MLSQELETFTIVLLSTFFNPLPFVVTSLFYWALYDNIWSPQFLGMMWRMRKQSIPGPLFEEERPGIEALTSTHRFLTKTTDARLQSFLSTKLIKRQIDCYISWQLDSPLCTTLSFLRNAAFLNITRNCSDSSDSSGGSSTSSGVKACSLRTASIK